MEEPQSDLPKPESPHEEMWETLELYEKWKEIKKFFATRRTVLDSAFENKLKSADFNKDSIQNPWKFNITQSTFSSAPALAALWLIRLLYEKSEDATIQTRILEAIKDVLNAASVPFSLMIAVMIVRRACLRKNDQSLENRRYAGKLYLYFDGSLGLYSQCLAALAYVLWSKVDEIPWLRVESRFQIIAFSYWSLVAFYLWQYLVTTRSVPRRIFRALGYCPEIGDCDKIECEGPWGPYRRAALFSVPCVVLCVKLLTRALTDLIAEAIGWLNHTPS